MVNQWGRDGNFSSGSSRSAGSIIIPAIIALIIGAGGGYAGARFFSGVATSDLEARDKKIAELQQTISDKKFSSQGVDTQQTVLRQRVKDLEQQVETLNRTKDTLRKYADQQASKAGDDAKSEIAALRKTIEEAGDLSTQLNRARKSLKVSELQIIELESSTRDQKAEITRLQKLVDKRGDDADTRMKALSDQAKTFQSALSSARKQIAAIPDLKRQIADLEDKLSARSDDADAEARKQIDALQKQKDTLQRQLEDALKSADDADAQTRKIAELQKQLDDLAETVADRDKAARDASGDLKQAKAELEKSDEQIKDLRDKNKLLSDAQRGLENQVATLNATISDLKRATSPVENEPDANDNQDNAPIDSGLTPRDRDDVEKAVEDLPGYGNLSRGKQEALVGMLEKGECVTDSLKAAYGHVSPISLRSLFRELGGRC
ncbi:MAG: hypothetical protein JWM58_2953 [Rhizobium sp.]|nr:hypothetical protein [Rhizobium sp.]